MSVIFIFQKELKPPCTFNMFNTWQYSDILSLQKYCEQLKLHSSFILETKLYCRKSKCWFHDSTYLKMNPLNEKKQIQCYFGQECDDDEHSVMQYFELYFQQQSVHIFHITFAAKNHTICLVHSDGHTNWCQRFWRELKKAHSMEQPVWSVDVELVHDWLTSSGYWKKVQFYVLQSLHIQYSYWW